MSQTPPRPTKQTNAKRNATVRELRALWRRGRKLERTRKSGETLQAWARRKGLEESAGTLYKITEFARRIQTQQELDALLALRTPTGMCLSWAHLVGLMSVTDAAQRLGFAQMAATEGLSSASLRGRIQAADPRGNRRQGSGRKPLAEAPREEAVLRVRRLIGKLRRQLEALPEVDGISRGRGSKILAQRQAELQTALTAFEEAEKQHASGQANSKSQRTSR